VRITDPGRGESGSEINPDPKGNRRDKAKKPATESVSAQGIPECEELYSVD